MTIYQKNLFQKNIVISSQQKPTLEIDKISYRRKEKVFCSRVTVVTVKILPLNFTDLPSPNFRKCFHSGIYRVTVTFPQSKIKTRCPKLNFVKNAKINSIFSKEKVCSIILSQFLVKPIWKQYPQAAKIWGFCELFDNGQDTKPPCIVPAKFAHFGGNIKLCILPDMWNGHKYDFDAS